MAPLNGAENGKSLAEIRDKQGGARNIDRLSKIAPRSGGNPTHSIDIADDHYSKANRG